MKILLVEEAASEDVVKRVKRRKQFLMVSEIKGSTAETITFVV